jgi:Sulfotransferase domain
VNIGKNVMNSNENFRILINGPEKTGTHLVLRLLNQLGFQYSKDGPSVFITERPDDTFGLSAQEFAQGRRVRIWGWPVAGLPEAMVRDRLASVGRRHYCHSHAPYSRELCDVLEGLDFRILQTIRDPRDQVQSMANWYSNERAPDNLRRRELGPLPTEERLRIAISGCDLSNGARVQGVNEYYSAMAAWYSQRIVRVVRFEDLVGPRGGGSLERQINEIRACARFVGKSLADGQAENIAENIYGCGNTFRKGKIDSWRTVFSPEVKQLFKDQANRLLLDLGYETEPDWQ